MSTIKALVTKHAVLTYFALTFAISWAGALLVIGGSGSLRGTTPSDDPRFPFAVMTMLLGPSVAGILLTGLVHGKAGLRAFLSRLLTWRMGARWYAVALVLAPVLMLATLFALSFTSPAFRPGIFVSDDKSSLLFISLAVGLGAGIFEELGWTGFAIPELRRRHGVLATGLIVGVVWSAWHLLPNVWAASASAGDLPVTTYLSTNVLGVLVGYLTAYRVLMVWVYDRTSSLLAGMLMHLSFTASLLILNPLGISGTALVTYSFALAAAIWIVVGAVALATHGQRTRHSLRARVA